MSSSKRHFTVVMNSKEDGIYVSSTPSSAARKAVSKLCVDNKNKKFEFRLRETTQGSNKKVYGPYLGYMEKLDKPIELKGRVIRYKPIAKLVKKSHKMKGGVIIGRGAEGFVLKPNINNLNNENKVSKLIRATIEEQEELVKFENKLNEIDEDGTYHVKMLASKRIKGKNINNIKNINENSRKEMKIRFNFKITYQYGGISIKDFLDDFGEYSDRVNEDFLKRILIGILNCFQGLYIFYVNGIVHKDLNNGNIVFFIDKPNVMRIIDWGILLPNVNSNLPVNSNLQNSIDKIMINSLSRFYYNINKLIKRIKIWISNKKISDIIENFLEIPNFKINIHESNSDGRILQKPEIDAIRIEMERLISQI
jgi:hypothetical protein